MKDEMTSIKDLPADEQFRMIISLLKEANSAAVWAFWRDRFNTNHPEHIRREEVENPTRYATANFYAAKALYCDNREKLDKYHHDLKNGHIISHPGKTEECELFDAMRKVVENEMTEQLEKQVLTEEE